MCLPADEIAVALFAILLPIKSAPCWPSSHANERRNHTRSLRVCRRLYLAVAAAAADRMQVQQMQMQTQVEHRRRALEHFHRDR